MKRPKIYPQGERSYHCGACSTAAVLHWFGVEPDPIPTLYAALRAEDRRDDSDGGLFACEVQSYFNRLDWVALISRTGGPIEYGDDGKRLYGHARSHQRIATWRAIRVMLQAGFLCILDYKTAAGTRHFAVVYDAFIRKNIHWLRLACSSQGYMEVQADSFLGPESSSIEQIYIKPDNLELR